jgi:hypothetical protein
VLRASAAGEAAGVPSSTLVCEGFLGLAAAASIGLGMPNLPVARVIGHPGVQSKEELRRNTLEVTLDRVVENLLSPPKAASADREPGARDVIVKGGFEEVNEYFYANGLSDGLPIVPPTREKVEAFLRYTDREPGESLGNLLPDSRAATVWSIAVNGVMAGCRPEYMPVLIALIEAMADPAYGVEHSGNTPGGETLIILNGPIIKELGFNYMQGVMRDGFRPNTSVGRFWRLYLRNVAGFLPHRNDKATFGNTWRVAVAENEDVLAKIGWEPNSVDMGYAAGDNTVTIARYTGGNHISSVSGSTPEEMMPYLCDAMIKQYSWQIMFTVGQGMGTLRPLMLLSPILAETLARGGWSRSDLKRHLFEHARIPAREFERILRDWTQKPVWNLAEEEKAGRIPKVFHESDDPDRMVPLVWKPEDFMIAVTGDLTRNSAYIFAHNGVLGFPVGKRIRLPKNWNALLAGVQGKQGVAA